MVSQSFSATSWESIPFLREWREHSRILWNPDIHGTSPPGCFLVVLHQQDFSHTLDGEVGFLVGTPTMNVH
jgi:hypothetical protein